MLNKILLTTIAPGTVNLSTRLKLALQNKTELKYAGRMIETLAIGMIIAPVNILESLCYKLYIQEHSIKKPPVFIIGHWRSGTTYLHNFITQDTMFGFPTVFQTRFPKGFNSLERLKSALGNYLPKNRITDNVEINFDLPAEEEIAIARLLPYSYFHSFTYPKNSDLFFKKYVVFNDISGRELDALKKAYSFFIKKISCAWKEKQLVFKNPVNTARIDFLLSLFPDAKFIHIYRNPYDVFKSTKNMRNKISELVRLHSTFDEQTSDEMIIRHYIALMKCYFEQKKLIRKDHLAEVKYEDLTAQPEKEIERIYKELSITFTDTARENLRQYLIHIENYKKNYLPLSHTNKSMIEKNWAFTIEKWGYSAPD